MELLVFIGLQASGKSSFYRQRLFHTHVRVSLDLLRTRHRERRLLQTCLEIGQPVVIDNTNPAATDRARYIEPARAAKYRVEGYYFRSVVAECLERNAQRTGAQRIPDRGVLGTAGRLERPTLDEGFDALWYVHMTEDGFVVDPWEP